MIRSVATLFFCFLIIGATAQNHTDYFLKLDKKIAKAKGKAKVEIILAIPHDILSSDLEISEKYFHRALNYSIQYKFTIGIASAKQKLGLVHYYLGEYDSSSYYTLAALDEFTNVGELQKAANLYCDYGHMIKRRDLKKAFELMRKGLALHKTERVPGDLSTCMNNFGVLHEMNNDIDSALFYYFASLKINKELIDSVAIPYNYVKIATALLYKNKFEESKKYIDSAHTIRVKRNDLLGITDDQAYYGDLYKAWGKFDLAIEFFKECIRQSQTSGYPFLIQYSYEEMAKCYEANGNAKEALNAYKEAQKIKDSLLSDKNTKTMLELEEKYKTAEKEKIIATQNEDIAERDLNLEKKARENILLYSILAISVITGILITYFVLQREKQKRQKALIDERERGLKSIIQTAENERRRIAKDLHDGVGQQLGGLKMAWQQLEKKLGPEEKSKMESVTIILNDTASEVRNISHQMMPKMLEQDGLIPAMEDMFNKTLKTAGISFEFNTNLSKERLHAEAELAVYRIVQEIIANMLKHSGADNLIIDFYKRNDHYLLMTEDNGKGFDTAKAAAGLGLQNIKARASAIGATIAIESEIGKGASFVVKIPF